MNLQALYDLKERLEHAAIAGTSLLQEDFRLRRAVEALAALAGANPVFAKIYTGAKALLNAPEQERSAKLLDVLSLVDAVVYTQGISNLGGELIEATQGTGSYTQASYGQLQPLLSALSGTGSGRTSLIREYWQSHSEYFGDFRILPNVVAALGDNYAELADLIGEILLQQGQAIIPLLKENFDPAGKTEMARRVRLVAKLAGERENDWFVSILPDSKKEVREAVIQSLGLSHDNAQLLIDLCQSERGKLKEAALRSLAFMQTPEAEAFWAKEVQKKPNLVSCLKGVDTELAADLCAAALRAFLEKLPEEGNVYDQSDLDQIIQLTSAAVGKYSANMDSLWYWIAGKMEQFSAIVPDKNVRLCDMSVAEHLQRTLMQTILWNSRPEVLTLAWELGSERREWFLGCAMLADMATVSAEELYEKYAPCIVRTGILKKESKDQRNDRVQILQAFSALRWSAEVHGFVVVFPRFDALTGNAVTSARKLDGFDSRWIRLFTDPKVNRDGGIFNLGAGGYNRKVEPFMDYLMPSIVDQENPEVCEMAGQWMHQRILETGDLNTLFRPLLGCGWKNWRGLLAHCFRKHGQVSYPTTMSLLRLMPMSNMEKAAELRELNELAQSGKLKIQFNLWPKDAIVRDIATLELDPNADL